MNFTSTLVNEDKSTSIRRKHSSEKSSREERYVVVVSTCFHSCQLEQLWAEDDDDNGETMKEARVEKQTDTDRQTPRAEERKVTKGRRTERRERERGKTKLISFSGTRIC